MIWLKLFPIIAEAARKVAPDYQRGNRACMMEIVLTDVDRQNRLNNIFVLSMNYRDAYIGKLRSL